MDKNKICEAMYALPGQVVVKRRKPMLVPVVLLCAGVAMIVLNSVYGGAISVNFRSALVFVGGIVAASGFFMLMARIFGSGGTPFYTHGKCFLRYDELYFESGARQQVVQHISDGEVLQLFGMHHAHVPSVAVAVYRTSDNRFAAMQAFEYTDLEYRPLTELKIVAA